MAQQQTPTIPTPPADLKSLSGTVATSTSQLAAAGSAVAAQIQAARLLNLKRAAVAASAAYGTDSKEATDANQAVAVAQYRAGQLSVVSQQVSTTPPVVASTGWTLHGRVYDSNLNPQEKYTVFLVDAQKNYLSEFGFSFTDPTGYFAINNPGAAGGSSSGNDTSPSPESPKSSAPEAFIQVYDANANPVLSSSSPFLPVVGQATYEVLTVPSVGQSLGDPPAEVRAAAAPPDKPASTKAKQKTADKSKS